MSATYRIAVEHSMLPAVMGGGLPACLAVVPGSNAPYLPMPGCVLVMVRDTDAPAELEGCVVELSLNLRRQLNGPNIVTVVGRNVLERPSGH